MRGKLNDSTETNMPFSPPAARTTDPIYHRMCRVTREQARFSVKLLEEARTEFEGAKKATAYITIFTISSVRIWTDRSVCLFVLRFYGPVNPMESCRARSVYLTTRLLGRLSPQSG